MRRRGFLCGVAALALTGCVQPTDLKPAGFSGRSNTEARLLTKLERTGHRYGAPVHIMAFKETKEMEIWLQGDDGTFSPFAHMPICNFSGRLGPKLEEGDRQTPEGYYEIRPEHLHPNSAFHVAVDLGFPNTFDRLQGRTGSFIEIHGGCDSIGCYAMGDQQAAEIFLLIEQAFLQGARRATLGAYPFRPTPERLAASQGEVWHDFWKNIAASYSMFMANKTPPYVDALGSSYLFSRF